MRNIDLTRSRQLVLDRMQNRLAAARRDGMGWDGTGRDETRREEARRGAEPVRVQGLINENHIKGVMTGYTRCIALLHNGLSAKHIFYEMTRARLMNAKRISGRVRLFVKTQLNEHLCSSNDNFSHGLSLSLSLFMYQ